MTTDKLRKEFEAWAGSKQFGLSKGHFKKDEDGEYLNFPTQCYWDVWKAARAALVIDVPDENDDRFWSQLDELNYGGNSHIFLEGTFTDAVHEAIEAAGVRVKP